MIFWIKDANITRKTKRFFLKIIKLTAKITKILLGKQNGSTAKPLKAESVTELKFKGIKLEKRTNRLLLTLTNGEVAKIILTICALTAASLLRNFIKNILFLWFLVAVIQSITLFQRAKSVTFLS